MINQPPLGEKLGHVISSILSGEWPQESKIKFTIFLNKFPRSQSSESDVLSNVFVENEKNSPNINKYIGHVLGLPTLKILEHLVKTQGRYPV